MEAIMLAADLVAMVMLVYWSVRQEKPRSGPTRPGGPV